jgi:hypothetical protein
MERKFTRGTPVTEQEEMFQESVRREYAPLERMVGAAWEKISFSENILNTRFIGNMDPIEVYRRNSIYATSPIRRWENPYQDFIKPYTASALNKPSIVQSAVAMGTGGWVFGGPIGAGIGAVAGTAWGTFHGREDIPQYAKQRRELLKQIDVMTYHKSKQDAALGDATALRTMKNTMTYAFNNATNVNQMVTSMPKTEREFMRHFVGAGTKEERERILNLVPDYGKYVLEKAWNTGANGYNMMGKNTIENPLDDIAAPDQMSAVYDPTIDSKDIAVKMLESQGFEPRAVGLGFQAQQRKMMSNPFIPDSFDTRMKTTVSDPGKIRRIVSEAISGAQVSVLPTQMPGIKLVVKGSYRNQEAGGNMMRSRYGI